MIALSTIVSENMVAIDNFVKGIPFQPGFLYKVNIEILGFHHGDEVLVARVIMGRSGYQFAISISGKAT